MMVAPQSYLNICGNGCGLHSLTSQLSDDPPDDLRALRDDSVAEGFSSGDDQSSGKPIIHSRRKTLAPATVLRPSPLCRDAPRLFQSPRAVGVGSSYLSVSPSRPFRFRRPLALMSLALGVGNSAWRIASMDARAVPTLALPPRFRP